MNGYQLDNWGFVGILIIVGLVINMVENKKRFMRLTDSTHPSLFVDKNCKETKCIGQGSYVKCGEAEYGSGSKIFYCEKCLWKIIIGLENIILSHNP